MKYLLDTHIMLWSIDAPDKIPVKVREILAQKDNEIYYSSVSVWEAAIKRSVHPDMIADISPEEFVAFCAEAGFRELPLAGRHVYMLPTLARQDNAPPHKDPFDRILISQAKSEHMTFITHDDKLSSYSEPCILYV